MPVTEDGPSLNELKGVMPRVVDRLSLHCYSQ